MAAMNNTDIGGEPRECVLCDEHIHVHDAWVPMNAIQFAHHECALREVLGGIGHQLAHVFWCLDKRDPDAGLTFRQSARMVVALVDVLGIEEVSRRSIVTPEDTP
jgi:hypothetical protein